MRVRWPSSKGGERGQAATELGRLMERDGPLDSGQLVRALSRAVVHIPMPDAKPEKAPRLAGADDGDIPLFVIDDEDGHHALVYSSPQSLTSAWKSRGRMTAAAVPMPALLARWPEGTDLVIDAGLPQARQLSMDALREVALDAAGVPTAAGIELSPEGYDVVVPDPEPVQAIGATRVVADRADVVQAMWRAVTRDHEPLARDVLTVVVAFPADTARTAIAEAMSALSTALSEADPSPARLIAETGAADSDHRELIDRVRALDSPYWSRTVAE
jgi:hypothetical protein